MAFKARMMTSAARTNNRRLGGFTLLEMVIVLLVIALLGGSAVGLMLISDDERALNRASVEVEVLAKRARTIAALQQRPYALEFTNNRVSLMPLAEASLEPADREKALFAQKEATEANPDLVVSGFAPVHAGWELDPDMRIFIRRWATEEWISVSGDLRQVWRFDPEGFCEPVGVRIERGKSWKENEFHPLTGGIRDSSMEAY